MKVYYFIPKTAQSHCRGLGGWRASRTVHLGEVLTVTVLSQSPAVVPLQLHAGGDDEQNGQWGFGALSQEEIHLSIRQDLGQSGRLHALNSAR